MAPTANNVIEKLTEMLELAKAGKMTNFAYHHNDERTESWGFLNISDHGQFVVAARLSSLALSGDEPEPPKD